MSNSVHFLNTGSSDCIILESDGQYAMIDSGEDTDFPKDKPWLNYPGYEKEVCDYLFKNCSDENGNVTLEFVMGTHCHSDHIGGFDTIIRNPKIHIKKAYLKPYVEKDIFFYERKFWDNTEVYEQMMSALKDRNIPVVQSFDELTFFFGSMKITFFNGEYKKRKLKFGENVNSVVTLIEYNGEKILLAGDMNYKNGGEREIASKTGKINILKAGHHGYFFSTSAYWAKTLNPEITVICNSRKKAYPDVLFKLSKIAKSEIFCTADCNGVKIDLCDEPKIKTNIMK